MLRLVKTIATIFVLSISCFYVPQCEASQGFEFEWKRSFLTTNTDGDLKSGVFSSGEVLLGWVNAPPAEKYQATIIRLDANGRTAAEVKIPLEGAGSIVALLPLATEMWLCALNDIRSSKLILFDSKMSEIRSIPIAPEDRISSCALSDSGDIYVVGTSLNGGGDMMQTRAFLFTISADGEMRENKRFNNAAYQGFYQVVTFGDNLYISGYQAAELKNVSAGTWLVSANSDGSIRGEAFIQGAALDMVADNSKLHLLIREPSQSSKLILETRGQTLNEIHRSVLMDTGEFTSGLKMAIREHNLLVYGATDKPLMLEVDSEARILKDHSPAFETYEMPIHYISAKNGQYLVSAVFPETAEDGDFSVTTRVAKIKTF